LSNRAAGNTHVLDACVALSVTEDGRRVKHRRAQDSARSESSHLPLSRSRLAVKR